MWWRGSGWPGTLALLKTAESPGAVFPTPAWVFPPPIQEMRHRPGDSGDKPFALPDGKEVKAMGWMAKGLD